MLLFVVKSKDILILGFVIDNLVMLALFVVKVSFKIYHLIVFVITNIQRNHYRNKKKLNIRL